MQIVMLTIEQQMNFLSFTYNTHIAITTEAIIIAIDAGESLALNMPQPSYVQLRTQMDS